jgi:hypothetical protein
MALSLIHTLYNSLQHALNLLNMLYLHRLLPGNGFQSRSFSASVLTPLLVGDCLTTKYNLHLSCLQHLDTDRVENTASNISPILASRSCRTDIVENTSSQLVHWCVLRICCLGGRCLQSDYLAKGLHATIFSSHHLSELSGHSSKGFSREILFLPPPRNIPSP